MSSLYPFLGPTLGEWGFGITSSVQDFKGCGYDKHCYISTAALAPTPFTTQTLIQAKLGGFTKLLEACDDAQPPAGNWNDPGVQSVYQSVIQNVTTEIIGYLSSIYPTPLMMTGTVAIIQVATLTTDGLNGVASLNIIYGGNYYVAPTASGGTPNIPAYLRYIDPLCEAEYFSQNGQLPTFPGAGLKIACTFQNQPFSDETGLTVQAQTLTPGQTIMIEAEGENYCVGDLLVLTGGQSFVPAKVREAMLALICYDLYNRRLAADEQNPFTMQRNRWRGKNDEDGLLLKIGHGDQELDGVYKRNFSPVAMWGQNSVYFNANSV